MRGLLLVGGLSWASGVRVDFGKDASQPLQEEFESLLPDGAPEDLTIAIGSELAASLVAADEAESLREDGYIIRSRRGANGTLVAVHAAGARGLSYGSFALLRRLGVDFLHPMRVLESVDANWSSLLSNETREPKLSVRGSHIHAEHPNELCSMINGFDAQGSYKDRGTWDALLPEWQAYLRWIVANGQNYLDWSLLSAHHYEHYSESSERQDRLRRLVEMARAWNLTVGIDATFSQTQEHGYRLWRASHKTEAEDWAEIQGRLDWLLDAGFQYVHSELGTSEFQKGNDLMRLLSLLNRTSDYLVSKNGRFWLENHISPGQTIPGYPDPLDPSKDVDFNWVTYYLDDAIVSRPHTVQAYSLIDPAPVYGGQNFSDSINFIKLMLGKKRDVVYYPETSYWCNYDTSVPLFLPLYALSRVTDLQLLRQVESEAQQAGGGPLMGQFVWESGWAWGSWLWVLVSMRSHWEDIPAAATDEQAPELLEGLLAKILRNLAGDAARDVAQSLRAIAEAQKALLVEGRLPGSGPPASTERANGFAYLVGFDSIADLLQLVHDSKIADVTTQPHRLQFRQLMHGLEKKEARREYAGTVKPLLSAMVDTFGQLLEQLAGAIEEPLRIRPQHPELTDLRDSLGLLHLRMTQVKGLYAYAACTMPQLHCKGELHNAEQALREALPLVWANEAHYGLFARGSERLWAYGQDVNPTGYGRGQYWTVHDLYYWRRDEAIVAQRIANPCFMPINDPAELYLGDGASRAVRAVTQLAQKALHGVPLLHDLSDCLVMRPTAPFSNESMIVV